jgi:hypothetical protein
MRYLAININPQLHQNWYFRCTSVLDCYNYFDKLGSGHGPRTAIFDTELNSYLWVDEKQVDCIEQINDIVLSAQRDHK